MSALISIVQNSGQVYSGYAQEVAKSTSYLIPIDDALAPKVGNPIEVPGVGTSYSYEVYIRLRCDLAPNDRCENFKAWYNSGIPSEGQDITVNESVVSDYQPPSNIASVRGSRVSFKNKNFVSNAVLLDGVLQNVGDYTSYLVFQLEVSSIADTGSFSASYTVQYDEF